MNTEKLIRSIAVSPKHTPIRLYIREKHPLDYGTAKVFGAGDKIVFGDWNELKPLIEAQSDGIEEMVIENDCRNSAIPLLDLKDIPARIEPGAIIREHVRIGRNAVVMMGAILNIGAVVGEGTMIDMNAVLGGRAAVGKNCHIGAGAVLAGVIEPACALPVVIGDGVLVGANAVILEGVCIGNNAVVAAGAVVAENVPENAVVAGTPARIVKQRDTRTDGKTILSQSLRTL